MLLTCMLAMPAFASAAASGGAEYVAPPVGQQGSAPGKPVVAGKRAKVINGVAHAPSAAPPVVQRMIWAGNKLQGKPYVWGGGHARWEDRGYDCSGTVSYVLHAVGMLRGSLVAPAFNQINQRGKGQWVTIYANGGHVYMVIAGLRLDTSGMGVDPRRGPRWRLAQRDPSSFTATHPAGL